MTVEIHLTTLMKFKKKGKNRLILISKGLSREASGYRFINEFWYNTFWNQTKDLPLRTKVMLFKC